MMMLQPTRQPETQWSADNQTGLDNYLSHLENAESAPLQDEMLARLDTLQSDPTTPDYIQNVASHFVSQSRPLRCLSGG